MNLYKEEDLEVVKKHSKKLWTIYLITLITFVVLYIAFMIYYATRPYAWEYKTLVQWIVIPLGAIFVFYSFFYLVITFGRVYHYKKVLQDMFEGKKEESDVTVIKITDDITVKYGVDFYRLAVLEWSEIENEYVERSILVDKEIKNLKLEKGQMIKVYTYSNMLFGYEDLI